MKDIIVPAPNVKLYIITLDHVNCLVYRDRILKWIKKHNRHWPRNFKLLQKSFPISMKFQFYPKKKTNKDLVYVANALGYTWRKEEIVQWTEALTSEYPGAQSVYLVHDNLVTLHRMNKHLVMLL